jgi:hypothetical protein
LTSPLSQFDSTLLQSGDATMAELALDSSMKD